MKYTNKDFINKSKRIHGDKYDYSLVDYVNARTKVKIICPIHGAFEQLSNNYKNNCPKCSLEKIKSNTTDFITKSKTIHKNKYDYSSDEFIIKSNKVHNHKYNYSLSDYKNHSTKVEIICPIHGIFKQPPSDHMRGIGCPSCCDSKNEIVIKKILEHHNIDYESQKEFDGCKYKRNLKFDFYLSKYNICIEYDGEQHYTTYNYEKDDSDLKIRQLRDKIKTDYCLKNNIKLIRIKYTENIQDRLKTELILF